MSEIHNDQLRILTSEDRLLVEAGNSTGTLHSCGRSPVCGAYDAEGLSRTLILKPVRGLDGVRSPIAQRVDEST